MSQSDQNNNSLNEHDSDWSSTLDPTLEADEHSDDSTLINPPCQRILDEQGYLIMCSPDYEHNIGDVLPYGFSGGAGYSRVPGPVVVIGQSTLQEWIDQATRFRGYPPRHWPPGSRFYKVAAE